MLKNSVRLKTISSIMARGSVAGLMSHDEKYRKYIQERDMNEVWVIKNAREFQYVLDFQVFLRNNLARLNAYEDQILSDLGNDGDPYVEFHSPLLKDGVCGEPLFITSDRILEVVKAEIEREESMLQATEDMLEEFKGSGIIETMEYFHDDDGTKSMEYLKLHERKMQLLNDYIVLTSRYALVKNDAPKKKDGSLNLKSLLVDVTPDGEPMQITFGQKLRQMWFEVLHAAREYWKARREALEIEMAAYKALGLLSEEEEG